MFDLLNYNDIIYHIKNYSKIYKLNKTNDWIQVLCPYCDDSTRKEHVSHGHFYISRFFNFCQCFRCDNKNSIKQFLIDINFENKNLLKSIFKYNLDINYSSDFKRGYFDNGEITKKHELFQLEHGKDYHTFINYLHKRIGTVDFERFLLYPVYVDNKLCISFNNSLNEVSTIRFIEDNNIRYYKLQNSVNYFFQKINNQKEIVICEGSIDLINLYKYSTLFNKDETFYIALNGRNYISNLSTIISNDFMIGNYNINIVFDKNIKNIETTKKQIQSKANLLNPSIFTKFYCPTISKDVSEFNQLALI